MKYTKEVCIETALKHKCASEWNNASPGSYNAARKKGWLKACNGHFVTPVKWTKEAILEDAKKYGSKRTWREDNSSRYTTTLRNGWVDDVYNLIDGNQSQFLDMDYLTQNGFSEEEVGNLEKLLSTTVLEDKVRCIGCGDFVDLELFTPYQLRKGSLRCPPCKKLYNMRHR